MSKKQFTYKDSGVDIEAGEKLVDSIKGVVRDTHTKSVLADIGGFGGLFKPDFTGFEDPVLVSSVDGVGTKLIVAFKTKTYDTVGQDLVNHCVNDIAVCGARPLFFLDYFSTGKLEQKVGYDVVQGFAKACKENNVALIGGETAEMPDLYKEGEFDLAGTIVGVVDREKIIDGSRIEEGDTIVGFESTGLHTNGYTLARNVLFSEFDIDDHVEELGCTIGEELLKIHRSYLPVIEELKKTKGIHGFAHITGGGINGNIKRIIPGGLRASIDWDAWSRPPVFSLIKELGNVPEEDMRSTFNLGIGLVAVADESGVDEITALARSYNENIHIIGSITRN